MESAELLKRLRDAVALKPDKVPEGWRTIDQWAKYFNVHRQQADKLVKNAYQQKIMDRKKFRIPTDGRGTYPTWHYKEVVK